MATQENTVLDLTGLAFTPSFLSFKPNYADFRTPIIKPIDATLGNITVLLPSLGSVDSSLFSRPITLMQANNATNTAPYNYVTILASGSDIIDGTANSISFMPLLGEKITISATSFGWTTSRKGVANKLKITIAQSTLMAATQANNLLLLPANAGFAKSISKISMFNSAASVGNYDGGDLIFTHIFQKASANANVQINKSVFAKTVSSDTVLVRESGYNDNAIFKFESDMIASSSTLNQAMFTSQNVGTQSYNGSNMNGAAFGAYLSAIPSLLNNMPQLTVEIEWWEKLVAYMGSAGAGVSK